MAPEKPLEPDKVSLSISDSLLCLVWGSQAVSPQTLPCSVTVPRRWCKTSKESFLSCPRVWLCPALQTGPHYTLLPSQLHQLSHLQIQRCCAKNSTLAALKTAPWPGASAARPPASDAPAGLLRGSHSLPCLTRCIHIRAERDLGLHLAAVRRNTRCGLPHRPRAQVRHRVHVAWPQRQRREWALPEAAAASCPQRSRAVN